MTKFVNVNGPYSSPERKRVRAFGAAALASVFFAVVSSFASSPAASADEGPIDATVGPEHAITCYVKPYTPYKTSGIIYGPTRFECNDAPDSCYYYRELQIWDTYDKRWTQAKRTQSSDCNWLVARTVYATYLCSSPYYSFKWRTKGHLEAFHGTWDTTNKWSSETTLTC